MANVAGGKSCFIFSTFVENSGLQVQVIIVFSFSVAPRAAGPGQSADIGTDGAAPLPHPQVSPVRSFLCQVGNGSFLQELHHLWLFVLLELQSKRGPMRLFCPRWASPCVPVGSECWFGVSLEGRAPSFCVPHGTAQIHLCVMLLKHPSPCHEIFMPFSKQAPAQQICTALPSPAPFTPRQSVLQRGWLWALL